MLNDVESTANSAHTPEFGHFVTWLGMFISFLMLFCSRFTLASEEPYFKSPSVNELVSIPYVGGFSVSPDGNSFAYVANNTIFTANLSGRKPPASSATGIQPLSLPRWSPDGRTIAFYCTTKEGLQLCLFDVSSGVVRQLTHIRGIVPDYGILTNGGSSLDFDWSDDSNQIAFVVKPFPATSHASPQDKHGLGQPLIFSGEDDRDPLAGLPGFASRRMWGGCDSPHTLENFALGQSCGFSQLFVASVQTGAVKQVTRNQEHHFQPIWSADSKSLWCVTVQGALRSRVELPTTQIAEVDLASGFEKVIVPGPEAKIRPRRSPDDKLIAFEEGGSNEFIPWSLVVITKAGKTVLDTRKRIDRNVVDFDWTGDSQDIILNVRDGVRRRLVRLNVGTQAVSDIPLHTNWVTGFGLGPKNMIAFTAEDGAIVNEVRVTRDYGVNIQTVLKMNPETANWKLGKQEIVRWHNSQGENLEGVLVLPTNFAPHQTYPLIVDMRGSSSYDGFQRDHWDANQLLAQHGYAVFYPILRAVHFPFFLTMGDEFHRFKGAQQGIQLEVDDVTTGVDELLRRGVTRRGSIGLMGFSVGGYGALQMATQSDLFNCVVAASTVYGDWSREYLLFSDSDDLRNRIGGKTLWDAPELYRELSIVYDLDRIKVPTLLIAGDQDSFTIEENVEIYNGLRELGRPVQLVRYPGEDHDISDASLEDYWRRVVDYFDLHLKDAH